MLTSFRN